MENKKFLSQANELGPNCGKAIRTETERRNLGVYWPQEDPPRDGWIAVLLIVSVIFLAVLTWLA